jgi:nucleotide-binding universal stress UspA family protein
VLRILLAIDASPPSQNAVDEIAARPWPENTSVDVLTVVEPSHLWSTSTTAEQAAAGARERVHGATQQLSRSGIKASGCVTSGDPKTVIVDRAEAIGADFVIVAAHGTSRLTRYLLGSVSAAVVRHAPCSVEVIRSRGGMRDSRPMRVLLATDGSEHSQAAALSVAQRPWPKDSEVRVLSVVEFVVPTYQALLEPPYIESEEADRAREEGMKHAQEAVAGAVEILRPARLDVSESISVLLKSPKEVILDEARQWGCDMILVGSHGRRGVERFLMGSVSEAVATHAECSVEVIRRT